MTIVSEEGREGSPAALEQEPEFNAPTRACAREDTPPTALLPSKEVTQRVRAVHRHAARVAEFLDRPQSLVHAQPPTFARARELHHEAARRHEMIPVLGAMRLAWGYGHMILIKAPLNFFEWVTETPRRFSAAVALTLALALTIYFGS